MHLCRFQRSSTVHILLPGPPVLKSVGTVTGLKNGSITFQIGDTSSPPPYPRDTLSFTIAGSGSLSAAQIQYSHPNMTLTGLTEDNIGSYMLTATNRRLISNTIIGSSTGTFNLTVLFPPVITSGPSLVAAVLGQPATLVCGTNLRSDPLPSILWRNSNETTLTTGGRYVFGNGSDNVYIMLHCLIPPIELLANTTAALFTQLWPGMSYDITVVAISGFGGVSAVGPASDKETFSTEPNAPTLMCRDLIATAGIVNVSWTVVYNGGRDITAVQITYTLDGTDQQYQPIQALVTPTATSVIVKEWFVASRSYSFHISVKNSVGISNNVTCGPVLIKDGIPVQPDEPQIISTKPGTITMTLSTAASGVGGTGSLKFIISSVPSIDMMPPTYSFPMYIDQQKVSIIINNIKEGVLYYFSIYASNVYGTSPAQFAVWFPNTTRKSASSSIAGPVAGGVIGGIVFVLVILIVFPVVIYLVLRHRVHKMNQKAVRWSRTQPMEWYMEKAVSIIGTTEAVSSPSDMVILSTDPDCSPVVIVVFPTSVPTVICSSLATSVGTVNV
eukprot:Em0006g537a